MSYLPKPPEPYDDATSATLTAPVIMDAELQAMQFIVQSLNRLDQAAQERVLLWALSKVQSKLGSTR